MVPGSELVLENDPGETLTHFPLMVLLDDTRAARDLMRPDASDLRFYDADHALLAHEIEQVGAPGGLPLVAWVRVPVIEGTATRITIEYGQASPPPPSSEPVWPSPFVGVWHLADLRDSTPLENDGAWMGGAMSSAGGMAGPAVSFAAGDRDAIVVADDASLGFARTITVTGWINPRSLEAALGYSAIVSRQSG